jgi:hypothetical protein
MVIEGSVTPAVGVLRRGRQALITRTDHIDDLERRGFIVFRPDLVEPDPEVVEPDPDVDGAEPVEGVEDVNPEPEVEGVEPEFAVEEPGVDDEA